MNPHFERLDHKVSAFMQRWGIVSLRVSLAIIFIWFGLLKPFGLSSAQTLVEDTMRWMPLLSPHLWVVVIGFWEVAIGITFLFKSTVRIAIALLAMQMVGTFMPLVILPTVTFQEGHFPYAPTLEGQYIIKNLLIISEALVIGGNLTQKK